MFKSLKLKSLTRQSAMAFLYKLKLSKKELRPLFWLYLMGFGSIVLIVPALNAITKTPLKDLILSNLLLGLIALPLMLYFGALINRHIAMKGVWNAELVSQKKLLLKIIGGGFLLVGCMSLISNLIHLGLDPEELKMIQDLSQANKEKMNPFYGFLASFYGGIFEEISFRFFIMSLLALIFKRWGVVGIWMAIALSSLVFGAAHLPLTLEVMNVEGLFELPWLIGVNILAMNSLAGLVFGWIYWKKGLSASILCHFSANIMFYVIIPSVSMLYNIVS